MTSKTVNCECKADIHGNTQSVEFQEKMYGKGKRAANSMKPVQGRPLEFRCTVCGTKAE